ncbi:formyltransferase family protein [Mesorhizobium sp. 10J20-29]
MTGLIVPKDVLAHFGGRAINVHPTMLPHYKGPVARSAMMLDGKAEEYGGVTIHALSEGIDEGPIISQRRLSWSDSGGYVEWDYAAARAAGAMIQADVMRYLDGELEAAAQDPAAGNYRRAARNEFSLSVDKPLSTVKSMFARAPGFVFPFRPDYPGLRDVYFVTQLGAVLGKPSGESPIVGRFSIETDILDARIRLVRKGIYHRTVGHPALKILASRLTNLLPKASVE